MVEGPGSGSEGRGYNGVRFDVSTPFDDLKDQAQHIADSTNGGRGQGRFLTLRCPEPVEGRKAAESNHVEGRWQQGEDR